MVYNLPQVTLAQSLRVVSYTSCYNNRGRDGHFFPVRNRSSRSSTDRIKGSEPFDGSSILPGNTVPWAYSSTVECSIRIAEIGVQFPVGPQII